MPDMKTAFAKALSAGSAEADHQRYCNNLKQGLDENQCKVIDAMLAAKCKWVSRGWIRKALKPQGINEVRCGLILNTLIRDKLVIVHEKDLYYLSLPDPFELLRRLAVEALPTAREVMIADRMLMNSRPTIDFGQTTIIEDPIIESITLEENTEEGLVNYEVVMTAKSVDTFPRHLTEAEVDYISDHFPGLVQDNNEEFFNMALLMRDEEGNVWRDEVHAYWIDGGLQRDEAMEIARIAASMTYICDYGEIIRPKILRSMHSAASIIIMLMDWDGEPALSKMEGQHGSK